MKLPNDFRWLPGGMPPEITLVAHYTLMLLMMVRGMDYATGESLSSARRLGAVEAAAPLWVWGALFTTAAAIGFTSMACRWWGGVIVAHALGAGLYTTVAVGIISDVMDRVGENEANLTWVLFIPVATVAVTCFLAIRERGIAIGVAAIALAAVALGAVSIELDGLRNSTILLGVAALHGSLTVGVAQRAAQAEILKDRSKGAQ